MLDFHISFFFLLSLSLPSRSLSFSSRFHLARGYLPHCEKYALVSKHSSTLHIRAQPLTTYIVYSLGFVFIALNCTLNLTNSTHKKCSTPNYSYVRLLKIIIFVLLYFTFYTTLTLQPLSLSPFLLSPYSHSSPLCFMIACAIWPHDCLCLTMSPSTYVLRISLIQKRSKNTLNPILLLS